MPTYLAHVMSFGKRPNLGTDAEGLVQMFPVHTPEKVGAEQNKPKAPAKTKLYGTHKKSEIWR